MTTRFKRLNYLELPEVDEVKAILFKEAKRSPAPGKTRLHYADFQTAQNWLDALEIKSPIFSPRLKWEKVISEGVKIIPHLIEGTLNSPHHFSVYQKVTDYLGQEDPPQASDLIFVFGSKSLNRINRAIQLWQNQLAPKIYITGGHPYYESGVSEAETFRQHAIEAGVPETDILIDPQSITLADNVRRSLNLFDRWKLKFSRIILITAWFAQRRSWALMMKYVPNDCQLYRVNSSLTPGSPFAPERWWQNQEGIKVIFNEFVKLRIGVGLNSN